MKSYDTFTSAKGVALALKNMSAPGTQNGEPRGFQTTPNVVPTKINGSQALGRDIANAIPPTMQGHRPEHSKFQALDLFRTILTCGLSV